MSNSNATLRSRLSYEPQALKFGTSGRRGEVIHLTQLEIYINALAELEYLRSLPAGEGGLRAGDPFYFAYDLRPSSSRFVPEQQGRGELAQAIAQAIQDAGLRPVNLGAIPTPALTCYALAQGCGSIMVTGSHIPFDRNGYKTNSAKGELLKRDEAPINARVEEVRARVYRQPFADALFDERGMFKTGSRPLPAATDAARRFYHRRYLEFFGAGSLKGLRLLVYQHSAVGRDLFVEVLESLGAEVFPAGRSDAFVPIDTENIDQAQLAQIQQLLDAVTAQHGPVHAVVSLDGDSDRPLLLGVEAHASAGGTHYQARFYGGDLVGMVVAEFLRADAVVVPISCNDAIDRGPLRDRLEPKTRIGSPFVIAGMEAARAQGRRRVCGWEANGGFLTGSEVERQGRVLTALPTRDALLPILCTLAAMQEQGLTMGQLFDRLPKRFSKAALLKNFPRPISQKIIARFSLANADIRELVISPGSRRGNEAEPGISECGTRNAECGTGRGNEYSAIRNPQSAISDVRLLTSTATSADEVARIVRELSSVFSAAHGFDAVAKVNYTDGLRIYFHNGDVAHVRPSGNADELRIYAVADCQERANTIAQLGVAEPMGLLRTLEKMVAQ
ncbi:MAG: hypothetical protein WCO56_14810 [Verrucomicrobiota bacterium]